MSELDIKLLASESLPTGIFPGSRNEAFRVYFRPPVHAALWKHAGEDTSVEICGVLVGNWNRDEVGPFLEVVESIRGEGATTKFAEVTFTHQTWARINQEMDTKFTDMKIVGWYHTHPDFGIFLSDRDRFIQEHFFSGPGQVAHVIDPVRRVEGVFVWKGGTPTLADHYWVGDRLITATEAERAASGGGNSGRRAGSGTAAGPGAAQGAAAGPKAGESRETSDALLPAPGRIIMYGGVFLVGYLLSTTIAAWERQRFVEAEVATNGVASLLRVGLAAELDLLERDIAASLPGLDAAGGKSREADSSLADVRTQLAAAVRRAEIIKERYANSPSDESELRYLLSRYRQAATAERESPKSSNSPDSRGEKSTAAPAPADGSPAAGKSEQAPAPAPAAGPTQGAAPAPRSS